MNPVIYAAAYLLLTGAPVVDEGQPAPVPSPIACTQQTCPPGQDCDAKGNVLRRVFETPHDRSHQRDDHHHHHHHHHHH